MAIKDWHIGQLVVLLVGGLSATGVAVLFLSGEISGSLTSGTEVTVRQVSLGILILVPLTLLLVTWKWFGGQKK